jgi:protein arginine kinase activator
MLPGARIAMICELCKKNAATVRYTEVVNKKVVKMNLCEECAKKKGVSIQAPFTIADLLSGLAEMGARTEEDAGKACPACGLAYGDFKKTGRLGCDACYSAFEKGLRGLLETIHKSTAHAGKIPSRDRGRVDDLRLMQGLEAGLRAAVEKEDFERAAELRDRIQEMKRRSRAKTRNARNARGADGS